MVSTEERRLLQETWAVVGTLLGSVRVRAAEERQGGHEGYGKATNATGRDLLERGASLTSPDSTLHAKS